MFFVRGESGVDSVALRRSCLAGLDPERDSDLMYVGTDMCGLDILDGHVDEDL
jgi:hypothetical protein